MLQYIGSGQHEAGSCDLEQICMYVYEICSKSKVVRGGVLKLTNLVQKHFGPGMKACQGGMVCVGPSESTFLDNGSYVSTVSQDSSYSVMGMEPSRMPALIPDLQLIFVYRFRGG